MHRSYNNFTEIELAIMQDIGYEIDRKNFYGRSIYNDGVTLTNEQGFSKRENGAYVDGYNNSTLGVGLHVFGSYNDITQKGNIFTNGYGGVGIRVDGLENKITVPSGTEIHGDGTLGTGVLVAYGKNQDIKIDGTVTANGEGGDAVHFEFGANAIGGTTEYRGSYMRYKRTVSNMGQVNGAKNYGFTEMDHYRDDYSITDLVNGDVNDKMASLTVNGKIEATGGGAAIYIAEESFVDRIDINEGATINGDIKSVWKQFDAAAYGIFDSEQTITYQEKNSDGEIETKTATVEPLYLQYKGGKYVYNKYIPDLVTNLNFNGNITYNGNITGADNMKMNVNAGTLNYGSAANVVSVNVANGAKLFGGTFTVNDMTARMAEGFTDDTTGKFFNHGTIGNLTIHGNLVSDGILTEGIIVNGAANVDGSTISAINPVPDETMNILIANSIIGNIKNSSNNPVPITGLLNGYGKVDGNKITLTTQTANNIGVLDSEQSQAFSAVKNMSARLTGDIRKSQLLPLYKLNSYDAGAALSQIGNSSASQNISMIQQSTVANKITSDRLTTAFSAETAEIEVGGNNFADGDNNGVVMAARFDYPSTVDNNFWIKFTKNWGELKGGAKYHGSAISGGYDRAFGENWRGGLFVSYNTTDLGANFSNSDLKDTLGGIYFGYHKDTSDAFIYIDGGKVKNRLSRSIPALGLGANANYNSKIFEIGGEYKKNLTPNKATAISPFINLQYSHLKQNAFNETGAGIFNQHINSKSNGYFAGTIGVEFKRVLTKGNYAARIGIKHAFTGADPELNFSYEGDFGNFYTLKNNQDKTHFILTLGGENEFAHGWIFGGDLAFQKGSHDKDLTAAVMLRKVW